MEKEIGWALRDRALPCHLVSLLCRRSRWASAQRPLLVARPRWLAARNGAEGAAGWAGLGVSGPWACWPGSKGPAAWPGLCARLTIMNPDLAWQPAVGGDLADRRRSAPVTPVIDWGALRTAGRACCCPARPVVVAVMPPVPGRDHPTDLLLCAHHYRASWAALGAVGAAVFDGAGRRVMPPAWVLLGER